MVAESVIEVDVGDAGLLLQDTPDDGVRHLGPGRERQSLRPLIDYKASRSKTLRKLGAQRDRSGDHIASDVEIEFWNVSQKNNLLVSRKQRRHHRLKATS